MEKKLILYVWNRCYGCLPFEVSICYGETLEEKKKYYENMGYYCWTEKGNN